MSRKRQLDEFLDTLDDDMIADLLARRQAARQVQPVAAPAPPPAAAVPVIPGIRIRTGYTPQTPMANPAPQPATQQREAYVATDHEKFTDQRADLLDRRVIRALHQAQQYNQQWASIWKFTKDDFMHQPSIDMRELRPGFLEMIKWLRGRQCVVALRQLDDQHIHLMLDCTAVPQVEFQEPVLPTINTSFNLREIMQTCAFDPAQVQFAASFSQHGMPQQGYGRPSGPAWRY